MKIGEIIPLDREITLNEGKPTVTVKVANTGDRPIQVGSHFHFFEVNRYLKFDREKAYGFHLDIPSGTSVRNGRRWASGQASGSPCTEAKYAESAIISQTIINSIPFLAITIIAMDAASKPINRPSLRPFS